MAVYEKELPLLLKLVTRVYGQLESIMNNPITRPFIQFFYRNSKLGKVTRFIRIENFRFGG